MQNSSAQRFPNLRSVALVLAAYVTATGALGQTQQPEPVAPPEGEIKRPAVQPISPATSETVAHNNVQAQPETATQPTAPRRLPWAAEPVPKDTAEATPESLRRMTADALTRLALFNIRVIPTPTPSDYAATVVLLRLAMTYAPMDTELPRRCAEAAWGAGDQETLMEMTQQLVKLDPGNTVAQLRLISTRLSQFQTTDERLVRLEQFLGTKGASLDAAVRSRLALDAALLYRERGDETKFVEKLKQATQLDSTNKDAALMALQFYNSRSEDAVGKLEMMANLLYADPVDPNIHYMLATHLSSNGAFDQARRFHKIYQNVLSAAGAPLNLTRTMESLCLDWRCEGPQAPFRYITSRLREQRSVAARTAREMLSEEGAGLTGSLSNVPKPEDVRLDVQFELVRIATSYLLKEQTELVQSIGDFSDTIGARISVLEAPNARGPMWTDETAAAEVRFNMQEVMLWRCITNTGVDKIAADLPKAFDTVAEDDPRRQAVNAWLALRADDAAKALEIAGDREDDAYILLARAEALATLNRTQEATIILDAMARLDPMSVVSTFALDRSAQISGTQRKPGDEVSPLAQQLATYSKGIPAWIDTMISQPRQTQTLSVDTSKSLVSTLDRVEYTLKMRNISPIPLATGSDKPMNTRFLFNPFVELASSLRAPAGEPEVYDLDRKLRLMPGEESTVTVSPDLGLAGYIMQVNSVGPTRVRYRVLQGFQAQGNSRDKGAGSLEATTQTVAREALLESRLSHEQLAARLTTAADATLPALLVGIRANLTLASFTSQTQDARTDLHKKLAEAYPTWSVSARTLCAAMMPPQGENAGYKLLDDAIKADTDPNIRLIALLTRVTSDQDPLVAAVKDDAMLSKAAALQTERLAAEAPTYAEIGVARLSRDQTPIESTGTVGFPGGR